MPRLITSQIEIGKVFEFAFAIPAGYLPCDGAAYDAVANPQYMDLYNKIGTSFGGTGASNFNVPNRERRVGVGSGGGGTGTLGNALGNTGGEETHTLSSSEFNHTHGLSGAQAAIECGPGGGLGILEQVSSPAWNYNTVFPTAGAISSSSGASNGVGAQLLGNTDGPSSSASAHNNIQPSIVMNYGIRY